MALLNKKTRQIMLYQMGYYKDDIDGKWGKHSKNATGEFQDDHGLEVDKIYGKDTDARLRVEYAKFIKGNMTKEDWKQIKYHTPGEFDCNCGCGYDSVSKQLVFNLDTLRHEVKHALSYSSTNRCKTHNKNSGGATNSRHYNGEKGCKAADVRKNKSTNTLAKRKKMCDNWIKYYPNTRYAYCNGYGNKNGKKSKPYYPKMGSSVHLDVE